MVKLLKAEFGTSESQLSCQFSSQKKDFCLPSLYNFTVVCS